MIYTRMALKVFLSFRSSSLSLPHVTPSRQLLIKFLMTLKLFLLIIAHVVPFQFNVQSGMIAKELQQLTMNKMSQLKTGEIKINFPFCNANNFASCTD